MTEDTPVQRVREFVARQLDHPIEEIQLSADVVTAARITGDDVWEFVDEFGKEFHVDLAPFRWYHHDGPEGCNPLWLVVKPLWAKKAYVPIRVSDLVESARRVVCRVSSLMARNTAGSTAPIGPGTER